MQNEDGNGGDNDVYDVFVSYVKQNSQWVTEELIKRLEDEGFSVCWDDRDFEPGVSKLQNKLNALLNSNKTIIVFSPSYIEKERLWDHFEGNAKQHTLQSLHLIPVMYEQCEIPAAFEDLWILDWSNTVARKFFWKKLIKAIQVTRKKVANDGTKILEKKSSTGKKEKTKAASSETTALISGVDSSNSAERSKQHHQSTESKKHEKEKTTNGDLSSNIPGGYHILAKKSDDHSNKDDCKDGGRNTSGSGEKDDSSGEGPTEQTSETHSSSTEKELDVDNEVKKLLEKSKPGIESQDKGSRGNGKPVDDDADEKSSAFDEYRQSLSPRLLGNFVPEDDDLSKDDVDDLTFKIEEVYAKGLLGDYSVPEQNQNIQKAERQYNKKYKAIIPKKQYKKFSSAQEQMRVLDTLQEWQEKIRHKFESCKDFQRKRVYRRLLERFNEAVEKTVNGDNDEVLLDCLPLLGLKYNNSQELVQCYCCDKLFHSGRALEIHLDKCVKVTWMELMKHVPSKRR